MANPSIVVDFLANTAKLVAGMGDVGRAGEQAGKGFDAKTLLKWTGAAVAVAGSAKLIKGAVDATTDLTKATVSLQRSTGLETETASAWVSSLQVRGIEVGSFQRGLVTLSKNMETWRTKGGEADATSRSLGAQIAALAHKHTPEAEKAIEKLTVRLGKSNEAALKAKGILREYGVTQDDIKRGDVQAVILKVADAFKNMENPAQRAAAAQKLFGRAGQQLLPILVKGSKGIQDQLDVAKRYGATIGDEQIAQVQKVTQAQRELALAHKGVQIAIGSALLPAQAELYGSLLNIVQAVLPFVDNANVMKGVLIAWAAALGVMKVATIASTFAQLGLTAAMLPTIAIVGGIVLAIAALIAIGVLLYKNWDAIAAFAGTAWAKVKQAAQDAFNWIKSNWPLLLPILLGPIGIAAALIIRHWAQIRAAITTALNAIRSAVQTAWRAIVGIVTATGDAIRAAASATWNAVRSAVAAALNAIRSVVTAGFNAVVNVARAAWNALVAVIRGAVAKAGAAARAVVAAVKAAFAGAGTWLVSAGKAVVQGLVNGILSMVGAVQGAAAKIADAAKGAISGAAGFLTGSPSRWAHQQGEWVGMGLANGLVASTPRTVKAAKDLANKTMDAAKSALQARASELTQQLQQAFGAKMGAIQTPAEAQLAQMQAAHDEAARAQALADARAQLAAAQTDEERVSAQRSVNDALYAIEVFRLQKQADAERKGFDEAIAIQQRAFDKQLGALTKYLASSEATAKGARTRINKLMRDFGLDFATIGALLGSSLASGVENSITKVVQAANKLTKAVKDAVHAGLKIGSPSKVMQNAGAEIARGLALGITRNTGLVDRAMRSMIPSAAMLGGGGDAQIQMASGPVSVRVFIGDQELRGMVRAEIVGDNTRIARRLLAGSR